MHSSYTSTTLENGSEYDQPSQYLGGRPKRQRSPSRRGTSILSKTYKEASTLYLTRRLTEALQILEPFVSTPKTATEDEQSDEQQSSLIPPIAQASRSTRIKFWSLYLTLLNAIIELGPEEGKNQFGSTLWRRIVAKVRDGSIWEEVTQAGYGGREGSVDADVVSNL